MTVLSISSASLLRALPGTGGPLIGRRDARRLARQELGEVSWWQRVVREIARLLDAAGSSVPHGWFGLIVLAALVVVVVIVVVFWVRPARARRARARSVLDGDNKTAADYRRAAQQLAEDGDYAGAIVEGVRAIAAELDEREILPPRADRTADELAAQAGSKLPGLADDLRVVTRLFDDVRYGDKDGTQAGYDTVMRLDEQVRAARPESGETAPLPALVVPR
ncbi:MAG TPA: DUF4129 domain-containing protein [Streptosporangiaceae bacterium]